MSEEDERKVASVISDGERVSAAPADDALEDDTDQSDKTSLLDNGALKVGCGCILPILFGLGSLGTVAGSRAGYAGGAEALGIFVGTILAGVLLTWTPFFLFWLRDKKGWIIVASLLLAIGAFTIVGVVKMGAGFGEANEDMRAVSKMKYDENGQPKVTEEMREAGPVSEFLYAAVKEQQALRKKYEADIAALGVDDMMLADKVKQDPGVTRNCDAIWDLGETIEARKAENLQIAKTQIDKIDDLDLASSFKRDFKKGAIESHERNRPGIIRQWDTQKATLPHLHRSCQIIARGQWEAEGELFAFNNQADLSAFSAEMEKIEILNKELAELQKDQKDRLESAQNRLKNVLPPAKK